MSRFMKFSVAAVLVACIAFLSVSTGTSVTVTAKSARQAAPACPPGAMPAAGGMMMAATMAATMDMANMSMATMAATMAAQPAATMAATMAAASSDSILKASTGCVFVAHLTGDQEAPDKGSPTGMGVAIVNVDAATNQVCYLLSVSGITLPAKAAHIHQGDAGKAGGVVVPFKVAPGADGTAMNCETGKPEVVAGILANPAGYYVNVHNADFPNGAVRGQMVSAVRLSGDQEAPQKASADGYGVAGITVDTATNTVCYSVFVAGIKLPATAGHIHKGDAGKAGGVVVPFKGAPDATGLLFGCAAGVDAALAKDILANPASYYVNIHNADFPNGAVRGQLASK